MPRKNPFATAEAALRRYALAYPQAYEEFPWGERAMKVNEKIFVTLYRKNDVFGMSLKLPVSGKTALGLPFAAPTAYGLGKSGWVTASFTRADQIPLDMLKQWIDESYRAVAPKKLVAELESADRVTENEPTRRSRPKKKRTKP